MRTQIRFRRCANGGDLLSEATGSRHVSGVALGRDSRQTVKSDCDALGRALLAKRRIPARLHRLATKPGEKCGLEADNVGARDHVMKAPVFPVINAP